jgi:hypothetical protein
MNTTLVVFSPRRPTFQDLELHGTLIPATWSGQKITHPVRYLFWVDDTHFHFLASDKTGPGLLHPESKPSEYQEDLWKYDAAEFFLLSADRSRYLEFNLGPNGSWWSSAFIRPRVAAPGEPTPIPDVTTSARQDKDRWQASIPLPWLNSNYGFGTKTALNATFILKSPKQIFLTGGKLGNGEPDFHRPDHFPIIKAISLA